MSARARSAPPSTRAETGVITRHRLLAAASGRRVITLFAPPGSGKTTLLAQLAERWHGPIHRVVLDARHREPARFTTGIEAVTAGAIAWNDDRWAVNDGGSAPSFVVLDDVHALSDGPSAPLLTPLVAAVPHGWTVAVAGRTGGGLGLASVQVQPSSLILDGDDLRFDVPEIAALFGLPNGVPGLDADVAHQLRDVTGGLAVAVDLARRTIADGPAGSGARPSVATALWSRSATLRHYVAEELAAPLSDDPDLAVAAHLLVANESRPAAPSAPVAGAVHRLHSLGLVSISGDGRPRLHPLLTAHLADLDRPAATDRSSTWSAPASRSGAGPMLVPVPDLPEGPAELGPADVEVTAERPVDRASLLLTVTGGFRIGTLGESAQSGLRPQHRAILQALAVRAGRWVPRDQLLCWFWPDAERAAGTRRLATAISAIRRGLDDHGVAASVIRLDDRYRLDLGDGRSDVDVVIERLREVERIAAVAPADVVELVESCLALQDGPVLSSAASAPWVDDVRWELDEQWQRAIQSVLDTIADHPEACLVGVLPRLMVASRSDGQWQQAITLAESASAPLVAGELRSRYERLLVHLGA